MTSAAVERRDAPPLVGSQEPRLRIVPEYISSAGQEAIELCALAGLILDPWEQLVLMDMLGERPDGKWASFEFGVVAARQNGKDAIFEGRELTGLFLLNERLIIHSAHEQATSSEHFRRLLMLIEGVPEFDRRVLKAPRGKGAEAIELRGGQRIFFKTRTSGGGRGLSGDLVVLNEGMILPAAVVGALVPTMAGRSLHGNPQLLYGASAVDQRVHEHGVTLARLRTRALAGADRVGYCEWSADVRGWLEARGLPFDPEKPEIDQLTPELLADPFVWAQANPGLGIRMSLEHIASEHGGAMGIREFAVERLSIGDWPDASEDGAVISVEAWAALEDPVSEPLDPVCLVFDVSPDGLTAAVAVGAARASDDLTHLEVIDHRPGTEWVSDRLVELSASWKPRAILYAENSPAKALVPAIERSGVEITPVSGGDHAQACGMLQTAVRDATVRHRHSPQVVPALRGAVKRPVGDAWAWSRKNSTVDIAPLVAVTLANWGAATVPAYKEPWIAWR